jgi:aryl-alcohol dehydrogenase-like predicted oxidoreductase
VKKFTSTLTRKAGPLQLHVKQIEIGMGGTGYLGFPLRLFPHFYFWMFKSFFGTRYFDTASLYGFGLGEKTLGRCPLRAGDMVMTKIGLSSEITTQTPSHLRWGSRFTPERLRDELELSLIRLRADSVHALLLHCAGSDYSFREHVEVLEDLKRAGQTETIGFSADDFSQVPESYPWADIMQINASMIRSIDPQNCTTLVINSFCRTGSISHDLEDFRTKYPSIQVVVLVGSSKIWRILSCVKRIR